MSLFTTLVEYFTYLHLSYFLYIALLLRRRRVLWWRLLLGMRNPQSSVCGKMVYFPLLSPFWTYNKFCNEIWCNKHWLCCLFHYLLLYVWNLILAHIKNVFRFSLKNECNTLPVRRQDLKLWDTWRSGVLLWREERSEVVWNAMH
jgi:hypothetical protein